MEPKIEKYSDDSVVVTKPQPDIQQIYSLDAIQKRQAELTEEIAGLQVQLDELNTISQSATKLGVVVKVEQAQSVEQQSVVTP